MREQPTYQTHCCNRGWQTSAIHRWRFIHLHWIIIIIPWFLRIPFCSAGGNCVFKGLFRLPGCMARLTWGVRKLTEVRWRLVIWPGSSSTKTSHQPPPPQLNIDLIFSILTGMFIICFNGHSKVGRHIVSVFPRAWHFSPLHQNKNVRNYWLRE